MTSGKRPGVRVPRGIVAQVLLAAVIAVLLSVFVARIYMIPSGSMEVTLHGCSGCVNDRVLVDKLVYRFRDPTPGEVVVFAAPDEWSDVQTHPDSSAGPIGAALRAVGSSLGFVEPQRTELIKRVIAVGGQTVACCDEENRVTVDGQPLDEPYISFPPEYPEQSPFPPVTLKPGELWVMGDNRNDSLDSRAPGHGPVTTDSLIGKARFIVLPFDRMSRIPDINPLDPDNSTPN